MFYCRFLLNQPRRSEMGHLPHRPEVCLHDDVTINKKSCFFFLVCYVEESPWYTKPQPRRKEQSERLRGERHQIEFIDLRFERRKS